MWLEAVSNGGKCFFVLALLFSSQAANGIFLWLFKESRLTFGQKWNMENFSRGGWIFLEVPSVLRYKNVWRWLINKSMQCRWEKCPSPPLTSDKRSGFPTDNTRVRITECRSESADHSAVPENCCPLWASASFYLLTLEVISQQSVKLHQPKEKQTQHAVTEPCTEPSPIYSYGKNKHEDWNILTSCSPAQLSFFFGTFIVFPVFELQKGRDKNTLTGK